MGRVIAVISGKGGVGKTTTAINLGQIEVKLGNHQQAKVIFEKILEYKHIAASEKNIIKYYFILICSSLFIFIFLFISGC